MRRFGILMAGCGRLDGSDPVESVSAMILLTDAGAVVIPLAPDAPQRDAFDHFRGEALDETRHCLPEASRIFDAQCRAIGEISVEHLDALFVPGGLGAVKTLCDIAVAGSPGTCRDDCAALVRALVEAGKPIGCVSEGVVFIAAALRDRKLRLSASTDPLLAQSLRELGHEPVVEKTLETVCHANPRIASAVGAAAGGLPARIAATRRVLAQLLEWTESD